MKVIRIIVGIIIFFVTNIASGYEQPTHSLISKKAYLTSNLYTLESNNKLDEIGIEFDGGLGNNTLVGLTIDGQAHNWNIVDWIRQGSFDEDHLPRPLNHFFDPNNESGLNRFGNIPLPYLCSSLLWGTDTCLYPQTYSYKDAKEYYLHGLTDASFFDRDSKLSAAFYSIGHIIHLIQDLASPAHVRDDAHLPQSFVTAAGGINGLICSIYPLTCGVTYTQNYALINIYNQNRSLYEIYSNEVAGYMPFSGYPVIDPANIDSPSKFWKTGWISNPTTSTPMMGLAEFTNYNFVSAGTNFDTTFYGNPSVGVQTVDIDIQDLCGNESYQNTPCPPGLTGQMRFVKSDVLDPVTGPTSENNRASSYSIFSPDLMQQSNQPVYALNRFTFKAAHNYLIPRAVAYSASLINYFFRGSMDAKLDTNGSLSIKNTSSEAMDGTFTLYYDDASDERNPVPGASGSLAIQPNVTGTLAGTFTPPTSPPPKEPGKYILVFNGELGQETNAVVGKVVTLQVDPVTITSVSPTGSINKPRPTFSATVVGNWVSGDIVAKISRDNVLLKTQTLPSSGGHLTFDMKTDLPENSNAGGYRLSKGNHTVGVSLEYHVPNDPSPRSVTKTWVFSLDASITCSNTGFLRDCTFGDETIPLFFKYNIHYACGLSFSFLCSSHCSSYHQVSAFTYITHPLSPVFLGTRKYGNSQSQSCGFLTEMCVGSFEECDKGDREITIAQNGFWEYFGPPGLLNNGLVQLNIYGENLVFSIP